MKNGKIISTELLFIGFSKFNMSSDNKYSISTEDVLNIEEIYNKARDYWLSGDEDVEIVNNIEAFFKEFLIVFDKLRKEISQ